MLRPVILCVDDERIILSSLKAQLHNNLSSKYEIEVAESAEEALEIINDLIENQIELPVVIADQIMPGMKGDELLSKIKVLSPQTLTIMLTGQATADAVGKAVNKAGLFRYLSKPWDEDDLILTIQSALDSYAHQKILLKQSCYQNTINKTLSLAVSTLNFKQQVTKALDYLLNVPCLYPPSQGSIYFASHSHIFDSLQPLHTTLLKQKVCFGDTFRFKKVCSQNEENSPLEINIHNEEITQFSAPLFIDKTEDRLSHFSYPVIVDQELIGLIFICVHDNFVETQEISSFLSSFSQTLSSMYRLSASNHALRLSNLKLEMHKQDLEEQVKERTEALNISLSKQEENNAKLRAANKELAYFATTDFLTGLFNRRHFFKLAEEQSRKHIALKQVSTVAMIDIDFFKSINDTYGHQAGDELLIKIASTLKKCLADIAIISRFGGEEFAVLLPDRNIHSAKIVCEDLMQQVSNTQLDTASESISVTVSIGLSQINEQDNTIEKALSRADKALYEAKENGRNTISVFQGN